MFLFLIRVCVAKISRVFCGPVKEAGSTGLNGRARERDTTRGVTRNDAGDDGRV